MWYRLGRSFVLGRSINVLRERQTTGSSQRLQHRNHTLPYQLQGAVSAHSMARGGDAGWNDSAPAPDERCTNVAECLNVGYTL